LVPKTPRQTPQEKNKATDNKTKNHVINNGFLEKKRGGGERQAPYVGRATGLVTDHPEKKLQNLSEREKEGKSEARRGTRTTKAGKKAGGTKGKKQR